MLDAATAAMAPRPSRIPPPPRAGVAVAGDFGSASGLAESARLMAAALHQIGVPTWRLDVGVPALLAGVEPRSDPPPGAPLVIHANGNTMGNAMLALPRSVARGRRVIGYWAWELPVVPRTWRRGLRFVHEIWVPSRFVADAIATILPADGSIPLRVVPHAVASAPPHPAPLGRAAFGLPDDAVIVLVSLNLASNSARKNPLGAIAAFRQAFGARTDRQLVLKLGGGTEWPADLSRLRDAIAGAPNIRIETRTFPTAENHAFTCCADIVLSLHRSEGFGLVTAEAMLLGLPVVATAWSGNMDYMDADSAALVNVTLVEPSDDRGDFTLPGARWAEPDIGEASAHLARLADNADLRVALGARGQAAARSRLTAAPLARAVRSLGLAADDPGPCGGTDHG